MNGTATTHMTLNETDEKKRCFPLEAHLNAYSSQANTYTLAFFDCCRTQRLQMNQGGRGEGSENTAELPGQLKIVFGCRAGSEVREDSKLSHEVHNEFKRQLATKGYVKTVDHQVLNTKLPGMDTRDNTSMSLYLEI